jgi:hypothetical protein
MYSRAVDDAAARLRALHVPADEHLSGDDPQREEKEVLKRQSEEEKEAKRREKEEQARAKAEEAERKRMEAERQAFLASPVGRARTAFGRGDHVFQYEVDVRETQAIIVAMVGSRTTQRSSDPVEILNAVCHEGWELVNGSFVFLELGSQSRDKFMNSGQNVAVKGTVVGYYLFRRCEENRASSSEFGEALQAERLGPPQPALVT